MDGKNKDELMMQQQVTHQTSPTMTAIVKFPKVFVTVDIEISKRTHSTSDADFLNNVLSNFLTMYQVDKRQPMRQKKAKENVQPRSFFDHGNNR